MQASRNNPKGMNNQMAMDNQLIIMNNPMFKKMSMNSTNSMNNMILNNYSNQNNKQVDNDKSAIKIYFRYAESYDSNRGDTFIVFASFEDRISDIIEKFRNISGDKSSLKFVYSAKLLDPKKSLLESGIKQNCIISVVRFEHVVGGEVGGQAKGIADPTKKAPVKWATSTDGPFYLTVKKGINLFGFCQNKACQAYKKEVCSPFGFGSFDLIEDLNPNNKKCPKCPACEYLLLKLESAGFLQCEYQYIGKKFENDEIIPVDYRGRTNKTNDYLDYVDAGKEGENKSLWVKLKIIANSL